MANAPATVPSTSDVVIRLEDVSLFYGSFRAVRDISYPFRTHAITAIIGPSGCGKSTLLRSINRMNDLVPSARATGRMMFHGEDLYGDGVDPVEVRRRIGMVFQKANPFPKSIYDNVAFGPRVNGFKGNLDDLVEQSLRRASLWDDVKESSSSRAWPCRAASSNACASPAPSPPSPRSSSWTSPARRSIPAPRCSSRN